MLILIHTLLSYVLPLTVGLVSATVFRSIVRSMPGRALAGIATVGASVLIQYAAFLVFSGWLTGNWPTSVTPGELLYGLAWFAIPAAFGCVPMTITGHVCGLALHSSRRLNRPKIS